MQQLYNLLFLKQRKSFVLLVSLSLWLIYQTVPLDIIPTKNYYIFIKTIPDRRTMAKKNIIDSLHSRYVTFIYVSKCFSLSHTIRYDMSWHTVVKKIMFFTVVANSRWSYHKRIISLNQNKFPLIRMMRLV